MTVTMLADGGAVQALDGASVDGSLYQDVTDFARDTSWLNGVMEVFTDIGFALFALIAVIAWWRARSRGPVQVARVVTVPVVMVVAYVINTAVKNGIEQVRPCYSYPDAFRLASCDPITDYSFPSNHAAIVAAAAAALFYVGWRWGVLGTVLAVIMAFSRVYVGAHYPHDVAAGLALGALVGLIAAWLVALAAAPILRWLTRTPLRPLVAARKV